jgi:hypothetical protein
MTNGLSVNLVGRGVFVQDPFYLFGGPGQPSSGFSSSSLCGTCRRRSRFFFERDNLHERLATRFPMSWCKCSRDATSPLRLEPKVWVRQVLLTPPPPFFLGVSLLNGYKSCFARTQSERVSELGLRVRKDAFCFYHATIELVFRLVTASLNG